MSDNQASASVETALAHALRLQASDPQLAAEQARQVLLAAPRDPVARLVLGREAVAALEHATRLQPTIPTGWLRLAEQLDACGDRARAAQAYLLHARTGMHDPRLMAAGEALSGNRLPDAERLLRDRLRAFPNDVPAMRMLAELGARVGVDSLLAADADNPGLQNLKAVVLGKLGSYDSAIRLYESILHKRPKEPRVWMSLGHALKTEGATARAIIAYRRALELDPGFGGAWWSLANLKTVRFDAGDIAAMRQQLQRSDLDDEQRLHFEFALGKALEDAGITADMAVLDGGALHDTHM